MEYSSLDALLEAIEVDRRVGSYQVPNIMSGVILILHANKKV
jgi:hypothetical protein